MLKDKIMSPEQAVALIKDGDTISFNGVGLCACGGWLSIFLEKSFLETGHPAGLTLLSACGIGTPRVPGFEYVKCLAHEGLLSRVILGHMANYRALSSLIAENKIATHNIMQGVISILMSEMAAGKKGYYTKVGLHTSQDPRYGGGCMNEAAAREPLVSLAEQDGEECLYFKAQPIDVAILQGSYADEYGNITFEDETSVNDAFDMAQAAKINGGKVIVLVHDFKEGQANAQLVRVPCYLVDAVVKNTDYYQCGPDVAFNPCLSGGGHCSEDEAYQALEDAMRISGSRTPADFYIARRAALEFQKGDIANLGIGIPQIVAMEARKMGTMDASVSTTLETGVCGGVIMANPFGASMNPLCIHDQASQFRFYEGGGLDIGFLGALEVDQHGNVNVAAKGPMKAGVGGFNFITYAAKRLVFCFKFLSSASFQMVGGEMVKVPGKFSKIVEEVESISFNAALGYQQGKKVLYVTERCVFELGPNGLILVEVAPGYSVERDILAYLPFRAEISPKLKEMPACCFAI